MTNTRKFIATAIIAVGVLSASPAGASTPRACVKALDAAEEIRQLSVEVSLAIADYFQSGSDSALAHASGTIPEVVAFLEEQTVAANTFGATLGPITDRSLVAVEKFERFSAKCRAQS